jgi:hypothetical protein
MHTEGAGDVGLAPSGPMSDIDKRLLLSQPRKTLGFETPAERF